MKENSTIDDFLSLFSFKKDNLIQETFKEFTAILKTKDLISSPNENDVIKHLRFLNPRDMLKFSIIIGDDDPIDYYSSQDYKPFFSEVNNRLEIREDEEIEIHISITKNKIDGKISIYFPEMLFEYLLTLDLKGLLYVLNNAFGGGSFLHLESQTEDISFQTKTLWFTNYAVTNFEVDNIILKSEITSLSKSICYFNALNQYSFVPDDFHVTKSSSNRFSTLFNRLCVAYSIGFLYDITTIDKSSIEYKLNGYKSIKGTIEFNDIKEDDANEYFNIYKWCYDGGNFTDKIGLARNIISLHLDNLQTIELKGNPYQSILSSYKVYEKQNIKQYIEIRNKISDQLFSFHDRANKIIETFASGFQKSALALTSFYISAIVLKLLGKPNLVNVFTLDSTTLSLVFIICSYIYFHVSNWEVKEQKKRFTNSYSNLKERYLDLLSSGDIERILNNDKEYLSDLNFIDNKLKMYSRMWLFYLAILFLATLIMFLFYNITFIVNKFF